MVYEWARRARLIAWKTTKRERHIPATQIFGAGPVISGLKDVVDIIGDPEAWRFLTQEWGFEEMVSLPLDLLKDVRIDEVLHAAPGFDTAFT